MSEVNPESGSPIKMRILVIADGKGAYCLRTKQDYPFLRHSRQLLHSQANRETLH